MNRDKVIDLLDLARNETDQVKRGLILAEAQVIASIVIMDHLEDIKVHAETSAVNSI
jgi:hypothetical protein